MRIGSLFAGIGGLEKGLEDAGVGHTIWQVEIDPFCRAVLAHHWPDAVRHGDVRTVGAHNLEPVDVLCGGFPCQDISYAGKGAGLAGARSGLWYEYARIVRELGPKYVVVENVRALLTRGLDAVLGTLADLGYDAQWGVLRASDVGAPHRRERVFLIAWRRDAMVYADHADGERRAAGGESARSGHAALAVSPLGDTERGGRGARGELGARLAAEGHTQLGHPESERRSGWANDADAGRGERTPRPAVTQLGHPHREPAVGRVDPGAAERGGAAASQRAVDARDGDRGVGDACGAGRSQLLTPAEPGHARHAAGERGGMDWAEAVPVRGHDGTVRLIPRDAAAKGPESPLWPVADGIPGRVARLRAIGNAVVPACAEVVGRRLLEIDAMLRSNTPDTTFTPTREAA